MSNAALLAVSLGFSLTFSSANPGSIFSRSAVTAAAAPARGSVEVDTSAVGEEGPALKKRIESRAGDILLGHEVLPARDPGDARFLVEVRPVGADEPGWLADVTVERAGQAVADARREIDCKLCTEGELVDKVAAALEELIPAHASAPEPVVEDPPPSDVPPPVDPGPKPKKVGGMGYAGIALAGVGVVGVGVGAGLLAKNPVPLDDDPSQQKEYQAPGAVSLAVGGLVLVTGVILIVVDQLRLKRQREGATAMLPWAAPGAGGLALAGTF